MVNGNLFMHAFRSGLRENLRNIFYNLTLDIDFENISIYSTSCKDYESANSSKTAEKVASLSHGGKY